MQVIFRTKILRKCFTNQRDAIRSFGPKVGPKYMQRIEVIRSATDIDNLRGLEMLKLHPLKGNLHGKLSIYLTGRYRLIVSVVDAGNAIQIEEVSNHYGD